MILTKCIPSLQVKCVKIPDRKAFLVTSLNVLFLSLASFSFHAEQVFVFALNARLCVFSPLLFTGKCDMYVSKYSGTTLRLFDVKKKKTIFKRECYLGPVVQIIVSLTSTLRGQPVKSFTTLLPNTHIFFVEKMREAFFNKKNWHI